MIPLHYDLHLHSCLSPCGDNESTPGNIVGMAVVKGLDVIALTDHNTCKNCAAAMAIGKEYGITSARGKWVEKKGIKYMPTWHPAALLRDETKKVDFINDLKLVIDEKNI